MAGPLNLDNPAERAKAAEAAVKINEAVKGAKSTMPEVPYPPDDHVQLEGGFKTGDKLVSTATVQELTGEHEEQLAKAIQTSNMFHFMDVLLQCGVKQLGDLSPLDTRNALKKLLVGDRDELVLAVRRVTYGDEMEILGWLCPACGRDVDITLHLNEEDQIKRVPMPDDVKDFRFSVELPRGGEAWLRMNTGEDQAAMFEDTRLTDAERNSILLSRVVETVTDKTGRTHVMAAEPTYVLKMGITDRHALLKAISEKRPGPRYTEVAFEHEECGAEVTLALGVRDLFRDLLQYL